MQNGQQKTPEQIEQDMRAAGLPDKYIQHNFAVIDKERHKEISSRGGKRSGEIRRQNAERRKQARSFLNSVYFAGYTERDLEDFRQWQRHKRYLQKKQEGRAYNDTLRKSGQGNT